MKIPPLLLVLAAALSPLPHAQNCPSQGNGGDTTLNRLKNRTELPGSFIHMKVDGFLASTPKVSSQAKRMDLFPKAEREKLDSVDRLSITLEGYLVDVKPGESESSNCHAKTKRGLQFLVAPAQPPAGDKQAAKTLLARSVVAVASLYWQAQHADTWRLDFIAPILKDRAKVRVSGWLLYNPEHPEQSGKTRGTLWEIHPVTKMEIWNGGTWREL